MAASTTSRTSVSASRSSAARSSARSPLTPWMVEASPWVRQSTVTVAPAWTKASRTAPSPNDSSSGCATTARTEAHCGSEVVAVVGVVRGMDIGLPSGRRGGVSLTRAALRGVDVEGLDGGDDLLEGRRRKCSRLGEDQTTMLERHQGRDRGDAGRGGQRALGLGVDLAEDDVRMSLGGLLEDRCEVAARAAPGCPEVDEHDVVVGDGAFEVARTQRDGGHVYSPSFDREPASPAPGTDTP